MSQSAAAQASTAADASQSHFYFVDPRARLILEAASSPYGPYAVGEAYQQEGPKDNVVVRALAAGVGSDEMFAGLAQFHSTKLTAQNDRIAECFGFSGKDFSFDPAASQEKTSSLKKVGLLTLNPKVFHWPRLQTSHASTSTIALRFCSMTWPINRGDSKTSRSSKKARVRSKHGLLAEPIFLFLSIERRRHLEYFFDGGQALRNLFSAGNA